MPEASSRFLAATFNRLFRVARQMTVGKTYVAEMLKQHAYKFQVLRAGLKRRPPRLALVPDSAWERISVISDISCFGVKHFWSSFPRRAPETGLPIAKQSEWQ
jgi:hypothetical protein